jgi:hypothetical protein
VNCRQVAEWFQNGGRLPTAPYEATIVKVVVAYTEFAFVLEVILSWLFLAKNEPSKRSPGLCSTLSD